jgi:hypothetical protein
MLLILRAFITGAVLQQYVTSIFTILHARRQSITLPPSRLPVNT